MRSKDWIAAAALLLLTIWMPAAAKASGLGGLFLGERPPEGLRIPAAIELLADTPYYSDPKASSDKPEGMFAPQTVRVLQAGTEWSRGAAAWQIDTMHGPRWIFPEPWEIDIAPPERIVLLEETPLYRGQSERGGAIAALSPQEVQVTGAEKQWFYASREDDKTWIRIHTTWLGDLWAHIPVNRIASLQSTDRRELLLDEPFYSSPSEALTERSPVGTLPLRDYRLKAELTTVYARVFLVGTVDGDRWVHGSGVPVTDTQEKLEIRSETPLMSGVFGQRQELGQLHKETVTAFEKVELPFWDSGTWYHVHSSLGDGWINPRYAEPGDAVPVSWKLELRGLSQLFRFPDYGLDTVAQFVEAGTFDVMAVWNDPGGGTWLRTKIPSGIAWISFYPGRDRLWETTEPTSLQVSLGVPFMAQIVPSDGKLKLFDREEAGYTEGGTDFLSMVRLAEAFRFQVDQDSWPNIVTFAKGDYAFRLEAGQRDAVTLWRGAPQGAVRLLEAPRRSGGEWYVNLRDVRSLFGLQQQVIHGVQEYYLLIGKNYNVELGSVPTQANNGRLEVHAFLYDDTSLQEERRSRISVSLSLEEKGGEEEGGTSAESREEPQLAQTAAKPDARTALYRLVASRQLKPGSHQVNLVLRTGARIVWQQAVSVIAQ